MYEFGGLHKNVAFSNIPIQYSLNKLNILCVTLELQVLRQQRQYDWLHSLGLKYLYLSSCSFCQSLEWQLQMPETISSWWKCHWTNLIHIILDRSFAYADTSSTNHQDNQASDLNPPQPQSRTAPGRLEAGDNEEDEEHQNLKKVMFRRLRVLLPLSMTKLFFPLKELKLDIFIKSFMWDTLNVNTLFPSTTRRVFIKL